MNSKQPKISSAKLKLQTHFVLAKRENNQHTMCLKCGRTLKMLSILGVFFRYASNVQHKLNALYRLGAQ